MSAKSLRPQMLALNRAAGSSACPPRPLAGLSSHKTWAQAGLRALLGALGTFLGAPCSQGGDGSRRGLAGTHSAGSRALVLLLVLLHGALLQKVTGALGTRRRSQNWLQRQSWHGRRAQGRAGSRGCTERRGDAGDVLEAGDTMPKATAGCCGSILAWTGPFTPFLPFTRPAELYLLPSQTSRALENKKCMGTAGINAPTAAPTGSVPNPPVPGCEQKARA